MSDLFGNHNVGFPMRQLIQVIYSYWDPDKEDIYKIVTRIETNKYTDTDMSFAFITVKYAVAQFPLLSACSVS